MQVSFLLDENIAAPLAHKLAKAGHNVERVVSVSALGEGVDDTAIRQYAVQEEHLIVTSDIDFVQMPVESHSGVFYVPDQSLPSDELYNIIQCVIEAFPNRKAMETVSYPRVTSWACQWDSRVSRSHTKAPRL
jgi:predicted nuclease of predicted toxin-antitoxin system